MANTVSSFGTTTWPSRTTATTAASTGRARSRRVRPIDGEPSARVTSWSETCPCSNCISRTMLPTVTASSTSDRRMCGVDTATSTPHASLNRPWFLGLLTRATTLGTANSCLASSEITRLSSSSPVAATTTSAWLRPAITSESTSQASNGNHSAPWRVPRAASTTAGSFSMSVTWCPAASRSAAMNWPTLPAPAIATLLPGPLAFLAAVPRDHHGPQLVQALLVDGQVHLVALLKDHVGRGDAGLADAADGHHPAVAAGLELLDRPARP